MGRKVSARLLRGDGGRIDIDAASLLVETHFAFNKGVDRVITPDPDIFAGVPLGAALAKDDVAGNDLLAAEFLHATALALAIATVLYATLSFFVGHDSLGKTFKYEARSDRNDLEAGKMAAMALGFVEPFPALELEGDNFLVAELLDDLGGHGRSVDERGTDADAVTAARSKHFVKSHGITDCNVEFLNIDLVANCDTILLSTGFDNCVCHRSAPCFEGRESATAPWKRQAIF